MRAFPVSPVVSHSGAGEPSRAEHSSAGRSSGSGQREFAGRMPGEPPLAHVKGRYFPLRTGVKAARSESDLSKYQSQSTLTVPLGDYLRDVMSLGATFQRNVDRFTAEMEEIYDRKNAWINELNGQVKDLAKRNDDLETAVREKDARIGELSRRVGRLLEVKVTSDKIIHQQSKAGEELARENAALRQLLEEWGEEQKRQINAFQKKEAQYQNLRRKMMEKVKALRRNLADKDAELAKLRGKAAQLIRLNDAYKDKIRQGQAKMQRLVEVIEEPKEMTTEVQKLMARFNAWSRSADQALQAARKFLPKSSSSRPSEA